MTDHACHPRITNGHGSSSAIVEMGAYEFVPVVLSPKSLSLTVILTAAGSNFGVRPSGGEEECMEAFNGQPLFSQFSPACFEPPIVIKVSKGIIGADYVSTECVFILIHRVLS
jgi:hypothetical protein